MLADRVMALRRGDEIARDQFGALMDQLVESVLSVRTGFAPDNRTGLVSDGLSAAVNLFTIAFHVALLEIGGKAVKVLVVWQNGLAFGAKKIIVPDAQ